MAKRDKHPCTGCEAKAFKAEGQSYAHYIRCPLMLKVVDSEAVNRVIPIGHCKRVQGLDARSAKSHLRKRGIDLLDPSYRILFIRLQKQLDYLHTQPSYHREGPKGEFSTPNGPHSNTGAVRGVPLFSAKTNSSKGSTSKGLNTVKGGRNTTSRSQLEHKTSSVLGEVPGRSLRLRKAVTQTVNLASSQ